MADFSNPYDDAILPDDFDPNSETYDLGPEAESSADPFATTEEPSETDAEQQPAAEPTAEEPTTAPEAEPPVAPPTIKVKFNHEERDLSYDEAAMYAQKGMNYDKLEERIKGYEALHTKMSRLAKDLEYDSPEEMIEAAANNFKERQVRKLMEEGNTESMARFLVDQQMKEASAAYAQATPPPQEAPSPAPQTPTLSPERKAELDEFVRAYPGVTKLPDEVIAANRQGVRLLVAYERHLNAARDKELAILKQNQAAAAKAPVTGTTGKAAPVDKGEADDPFLMGFNKDY